MLACSFAKAFTTTPFPFRMRRRRFLCALCAIQRDEVLWRFAGENLGNAFIVPSMFADLVLVQYSIIISVCAALILWQTTQRQTPRFKQTHHVRKCKQTWTQFRVSREKMQARKNERNYMWMELLWGWGGMEGMGEGKCDLCLRFRAIHGSNSSSSSSICLTVWLYVGLWIGFRNVFFGSIREVNRMRSASEHQRSIEYPLHIAACLMASHNNKVSEREKREIVWNIWRM